MNRINVSSKGQKSYTTNCLTEKPTTETCVAVFENKYISSY